jgi:CO/xanthine dehydrogenase FAD-binding subunit
MITAYYRPQSLDQAIRLIARTRPRTIPLGGGTVLSHGQVDPFEVVDLQLLRLDRITRRGNNLEIGATVTLQKLLEDTSRPAAMQPALKLEAPLNLRTAATVAGTLAVCDGRSALVTVLLALDTKIAMMKPNPESIRLGDFLPVRSQMLPGSLITAIEIPSNAQLAFEYVSRTPADKPIVCVALARWPSGRTRVAVGGYGSAPMLAMDGPEAQGVEAAARNALHDAGDQWGSAEYRMDVAATLATRCMANIAAKGPTN